MSKLQIPVYDDFTIDIDKYPRRGTVKQQTDIVIIQHLLNQDYLERIAKCYTTAIQFYNECKEYFFIFKSMDNRLQKKYSAKDLITYINQMNTRMSQTRNIFQQQKIIREISEVDQLLYLLIRNKDFYTQLFYMVQDAKLAFFQRREINYKLIPPFDFYGDLKIKGQVYTAIELLEISAYAQFLVKNRIIKNLPEPLFMRDYFDLNRIKKDQENKDIGLEEELENENKTNDESESNSTDLENDSLEDQNIKIIYFS